MSIVTLFQSKRQRLLGPLPDEGGLLLDAVIEETIEYKANATMFPIELGAEITDHFIPLPPIYTIVGVVSDNTIHWLTTTYQNVDGQTRHLSAFAILRDLHRTQQVFDLSGQATTGYLDLTDVVLVGFRSTKTARSANTFNFEATLMQINIVESQETTEALGSVEAGEQGEQGLDAANAGEVAGKETSSLLFDLSGEEFIDGVQSYAKELLESVTGL